jgi:hypothetical protein
MFLPKYCDTFSKGWMNNTGEEAGTLTDGGGGGMGLSWDRKTGGKQ